VAVKAVLAHWLVAGSVALATLAGVAQAAGSEQVRMRAGFIPLALGKPSTISLSFRVRDPGAKAPPPLRRMTIRYPNELGIALSGLGIETCTVETLEFNGPSGCPTDSLMGRGSALAALPFGPEVLYERAKVWVYRAPDANGYINLLFYAEGHHPVIAHLVLTAELLPERPPYGGRIAVSLPLIPSLPEAPPVSIVKLSATLGPRGITYIERRHHRLVRYKPTGIYLPQRCPRSGFPWSATFAFQDGHQAATRIYVPCSTQQTFDK